MSAVHRVAFESAEWDDIINFAKVSPSERLWNIKVDTSVEPSNIFKDTYYRLGRNLEFFTEGECRAVINTIIFDVVDQFPDLMLTLERFFSVSNADGTHELHGILDYGVFQRKNRYIPHLVLVEAKESAKVDIVQCIARCAAIHQHQKTTSTDRKHHAFGIYTDGLQWIFMHIDQYGHYYRTPPFPLRLSHYDQQVLHLYRMVYYVFNLVHEQNSKMTSAQFIGELDGPNAPIGYKDKKRKLENNENEAPLPTFSERFKVVYRNVYREGSEIRAECVQCKERVTFSLGPNGKTTSGFKNHFETHHRKVYSEVWPSPLHRQQTAVVPVVATSTPEFSLAAY
ncbi:hypothetical protein MP638_006865, partial [Amoeboaphelidium occidentale]